MIRTVFESIHGLFSKKIFRFVDYPLTILTVYACTFFLYQDFGIRVMLGYGVLSVILCISIIRWIGSNEKLKLNIFQYTYLFLVMVILINYVRPDAYHDKESFAYIVIMIISLGYLLFSKIRTKDLKLSIKVFVVTSLVFSILIIFFQVFQSAYWVSIYPFLSETAKELAKKYFFRGYSVSFGGVAYTSYIVFIGFVCVLTDLIYSKREKKHLIALYTILGLQVLTLFLLGRRGELAAVIVSLILYYIFRAEEGKKFKRALLVAGVMVLALLLIVLLLPILTKVKFLHRYTMTLNAIIYGTNITGGVTSGRVELYQEAFRLFSDNKIFGIGWASFTKHGYLVLGKPEGTIRNVHNIVVQLLAETGIVGLIGVLTPLYFAYYKTYGIFTKVHSKISKIKISSVMKSAITISLMVQTFILFIAFLDPINYKNIFWIIYCIAILIAIYVNSRLIEE